MKRSRPSSPPESPLGSCLIGATLAFGFILAIMCCVVSPLFPYLLYWFLAFFGMLFG